MEIADPPPTTLAGPDGPARGLWAGRLAEAMLDPMPGSGRVRRWAYAAAASSDGRVVLGAAVVDVGLAGTAFAWLARRSADGATTVATWERRLPGWRASVPTDDVARARTRDGAVDVDPLGGLRLELADVHGAPLRVELAAQPTTAIVCATPTPRGGWNATEKAAGYAVRGTVAHGEDVVELDGLGWRDRTAGRQDRHTTWRWAAGAGRSRDGRAVGLNASTGMNALGPGEDVCWVDGRPVALDVKRLEPAVADRPRGVWVVEGPGWGLEFLPHGVRAARENLLVVRSDYVQPIGAFTGTLPAPGGGVVEVADLPGVTEDHEAVW